MKLIKSLDRKYGNVLILKYFYDMTDREIADDLGISLENVKMRLHRGKKALNQNSRRKAFMTDERFDNFLMKTVKNFGENYITFSDNTVAEHTFSKRFERKMGKLAREESSIYFPLVKTPLRKAVLIIIALAAGSVRRNF